MRVLFDQGTPVPLRKHLAEHDVVTAFEAGWSEPANGELLAKAEAQFDLFITTDQQLRYQQNLTGRKISILVLPSASWPNWSGMDRRSRPPSPHCQGGYLELQLD